MRPPSWRRPGCRRAPAAERRPAERGRAEAARLRRAAARSQTLFAPRVWTGPVATKEEGGDEGKAKPYEVMTLFDGTAKAPAWPGRPRKPPRPSDEFPVSFRPALALVVASGGDDPVDALVERIARLCPTVTKAYAGRWVRAMGVRAPVPSIGLQRVWHLRPEFEPTLREAEAAGLTAASVREDEEEGGVDAARKAKASRAKRARLAAAAAGAPGAASPSHDGLADAVPVTDRPRASSTGSAASAGSGPLIPRTVPHAHSSSSSTTSSAAAAGAQQAGSASALPPVPIGTAAASALPPVPIGTAAASALPPVPIGAMGASSAPYVPIPAVLSFEAPANGSAPDAKRPRVGSGGPGAMAASVPAQGGSGGYPSQRTSYPPPGTR